MVISIPVFSVNDDRMSCLSVCLVFAIYICDDVRRIFFWQSTNSLGLSLLAFFLKAETVLLVSDKANDSDVLLVSFELEQMLSEIPPRQDAPKVQQ